MPTRRPPRPTGARTLLRANEARAHGLETRFLQVHLWRVKRHYPPNIG